MILIADAGSTKTDWLFLSKQKEIIPLKSAGLNPIVTTAREIDQRLSAIFKELSETAKVEEIHFFGAGCWNCLLYTSPSPRDATLSRMPSSA